MAIPVSSSCPTIDDLRCFSPKGSNHIRVIKIYCTRFSVSEASAHGIPTPLPALIGPLVHVPVGGGATAAPPRVLFETAFSSARAKLVAPVTLRVNPFAKYARPKIGLAIPRVRASASSCPSASGVVHPVPKG